MSDLEARIKQLEKTISEKDMSVEDKQKLLVEVEELKRLLVGK